MASYCSASGNPWKPKMEHRARVRNFFNSEPIDRVPFVDWGGHPCFYMDKWKKDGSIPPDADPFVLAGFDGSEGPGTDEIIDKDHHNGHLYIPTKGFEQVNFNIYAVPEFEVVQWTDEKGYQYQIEPRGGGVSKRIPPTKENPLGGLIGAKPPVATREDWEIYKTHYDGKDINRYPFQAGEREIKRYRETKLSVNLGMNSIFPNVMNTVGWDHFYDKYIEEPDFIEEMLEFYTNFAIDLAIPALERFQIDTGSIVELLGYTGGLWISRDIFRELLLPRYKRMVATMKAHGIKYVYFDSIGALKNFIPDLIDIGINGLYGVYMADGMDVVELKREYGRDFFFMGGIDRRIVSNGTRDEIKKEVERVMTVLPIGGYLPHLDGSIFYGTPAENYFYYAELVGKSIGAI
jgi:hypothetical protein